MLNSWKYHVLVTDIAQCLIITDTWCNCHDMLCLMIKDLRIHNNLLKESKLKDYFSKNFNLSPKCHFVTYYSHFRVLGNLAKIFGLNRGKTPKKNANFDFWSLISKFHNFRKPTFVKAWWRDVNESTNSCKFASCGNCKSEWLKSLEIILQIALVHGLWSCIS